MIYFTISMLLSGEDHSRFRKVYRRYFKVIYGVVARYHPNQANDITAEIFEKKILKAVQKGLFQNRDDTALAITIAKNYCTTIFNRKKGKRLIPLEEDNLGSSISLDNPSLRIDLKIDLKNAFASLSDKQRIVMELTIEGYADAEIAERMSTTVGAVRQLRSRAMGGFKKFFRD